MTNVLFAIETSDPDGAEKMVMSLADSLDKNVHRPVFCLLQEGWLADESRRRGYPTYVIPLERMVDAQWVRQVREVLRAERIEIIHANEFAMNTYGTLLGALAGVPCVATVHGKNYSSDRWHRRAAYRVVARCANLVAVSDDIREFLATKVGVSASRIRTIPNGIDINRYSKGEKAELRKELGLSPNQPIVGCVGRLETVKGHTHLISAARVVCQRYPRAAFIFAGQGQLHEVLQRQARIAGLGKNVHFLGYRADVAAVLAALDVFVLPSLSEGLPLSLLEAMAAGVPVVASGVGGIPEVVKDGQDGMLVAAGDAAGIAAKLLMLLDDPLLGKALAQNARAVVHARYGIGAMVTAYENLYEELLSSKIPRVSPPLNG